GDAWRAHSPAPRRSRTGWYVAGFVAALALLLVALAPGRVTGLFGGSGDEETTALGAETARPSAPPPTGDTQRPTVAEPFRGSPALRWADDADGITVPAARATGWMDRAQVARALERSRDFLVASSLDRDVLRGERPGEAIGYINPEQPKEKAFIETSLRDPSEEFNPLVLFSRFDGTKVRLVGDVVKVRGRISFAQAPGADRALRVTTDVTYVYPVTAVRGDSDEVTRVIVRREVVMDWADPDRIRMKDGTFAVVSNKIDTTNAGCRSYTGYLTPTFGSGERPDGPVVDPYDRSSPLAPASAPDGEQECGTASRS
ncbi:hypothetical protein GTW43_10560, partial [Streptomyces sp. SID5785]|uniref:hypothetical protein n=1 Tax=Streptomyces sp. SID5785 TaxID=2690309 RepID=UPI0013614826